MREFLSSFAKIEFDKVKQRIGRYLQTPVGIEHLGEMVPSADQEWIRRELLFTSEMKRMTEEGTPLPLSGFPDLRVTLQRASIIEYVLPATELLAIGRLASNVREIKTFFSKISAGYPAISGVVSGLVVDKILEFNIRRAIDDEGRVIDGASKTLQTIRRSLGRKSEMLRTKMENILRSLQKKGFTQEELITTRDGRLVIPVRAEYKHQVPGFIHSISASGATAFVEPTQTLELNNEMRSLESQEAQEIQKILADLTKQVRKSIPEQLSNISILGRLDFLNAKAKYSVEISGSAPKLAGSRRLRLKKALHPLLLTKHGREEITPLELESGHEYNTLIISGPNAGGKSVAMKTVGLLNVMTQSGCHIPASPDSEIPVFSELFVEMGDDQSIENDLSTFSSHLNNLKIILEHATTKSLVLIDEIGNGTDPSLGSAIGIAVLESLCGRDAMTIVTSHHSAFKSCGFEKDKMENAGMGFDTETLKPNYRLSVGMPGNSYALEIAKNLEFPADTLKRSFELTGEENVKLTEYLTRFESRTNELETLLRKTRAEREKLSETITYYESRIADAAEEVRAIRSKARVEAKDLLRGVKGRIESIVKEIRESTATPRSIGQAREELRRLNKTVEENDEIQQTRPEFDISVGQGVKISGSDAVCEVLEVMPHGKVRILTGGKTIIVQKNQLEPTEDKAGTGFVHRKLVELSEPKNEIDLRGLYGDEAINAIDMFIDRALLAGLSQVRIIHGKGTGALRKRVAEYLGGNKKVASFQLGQWNEGGTGVTVAILGE